MKTPILLVRVLLLLPLLVSSSAFCAEKQLPTVVVAKTEPQGIGHWQPAMGDGLAQCSSPNCPSLRT
jgi:hypothetical protein